MARVDPRPYHEHRFGEPADLLIAHARAKLDALVPLTQEERLLIALSNGPRTVTELLAAGCSHRFGSYVFRLRRKGVQIVHDGVRYALLEARP